MLTDSMKRYCKNREHKISVECRVAWEGFLVLSEDY